MRLPAMFLALSTLLSGSPHAQANDSDPVLTWDAYVTISAIADGKGQWYSCGAGLELLSAKTNRGLSAECEWTSGVVHFKSGPPPFHGTLQQTLDHHVAAPAGQRAIAMGPLAYAYMQQDRIGQHLVVSKNKINIAYRLVPAEATRQAIKVPQ